MDVAQRLEAVLATWNRSDAPGLIASVVQHGKPLLRRGYGLASLESMQANSPSTRMRIGSTTKHFASTMALLLQHAGKLNIDDPVGKWVTELPATQGRRTLRQLMNHTGGTRDALDLSLMSNGSAIMPTEGALDYQVRQRDDNFAPGERFSYNNGGYRLLSIVIERVLNLPFSAGVKEWLFDPLGLHETSVWASDLEPQRGIAQTHLARPSGKFEKGIFPAVILGEGAIVSTLDDMQRWLSHLLHPTLWDRRLSEALMEPTTLNNGYVSPYGLGLIRENWRGVEIVHHAGGVVGGSCQMLAVPSHGLQVVVMTNRNDVSAPDIAQKLVEAVLGSELSPTAEPLKAGGFEALLGHYHCASTGDHIQLADMDGALVVKYFGMPLPLTQGTGKDLVVNLLSVIALKLSPRTFGSDGKLNALTMHEQGWTHHYERVEPTSSKDISKIAGPWASSELGADIVIESHQGDDARDAGRMKVRGLYGRGTYRLVPLVEDSYLLENLDGDVPMNGTLRLIGGELSLSTMRTQNLRLRRGAN